MEKKVEKFPIDLVYTWVENDPVHQKLKNEFTPGHSINTADSNRFRCNREIEQSIKSALVFAPWIRNIFVVCANYHYPGFLMGLSTKIKIIKHCEIYEPYKQHLPTFNSHSIECHLHKIPELAEHFLYANDDTFFGSPVVPSLFFTSQGEPILVPSGNSLESKSNKRTLANRIPKTESYIYARHNLTTLLDKHYGTVKQRPRIIHQIKPLTKELCCDAWNKFRGELTRTSATKLRSTSDVWPIGLMLYSGLEQNKVKLGAARSMYYSVSERTNLKQFFAKICKNKVHLYCINDVMKSPSPQFIASYQKYLQTSLPHNISKINILPTESIKAVKNAVRRRKIVRRRNLLKIKK